MADVEDDLLLPMEGELRGPKGRFLKGNKVGKGRPKGAKNVIVTSIKEAMNQAVANVGGDGKGSGGIIGFLERVARENPSFMAAAVIRATVPPAREPEPGEPGEPGATIVNEIHVIGIPSGWSVTPLHGQLAHMPTETLHRLKEILPAEAFDPILDPYLPAPIDDTPLVRLPTLKVYSNDEFDPDPEAA